MRYAWFHRQVIPVLLAFDFLFNARLYRLLDFLPLQSVILGGVTLIILAYLFLAFLRFYYIWVALEVGIFCIILSQMWVFEGRTGIAPDFNAFFQYVWVLTLIVFVVAVRDGMNEFIVQKLLTFSTAYAALYVLLAVAYKVGVLPQSIASGIVSDLDDRGARLFSYSIAINFAWFAWMVRYRLRPSSKALMGMLVCLVASALAISRVSLLFTFVLTALYLAGLRARYIQWIAVSIFCVITLPSLYGLIDMDWNPYSTFASDLSGAYRMLEYNIARVFILDDPISAFGIAPGFRNAASLLLKSEVYSGDLGPFGVWFNFGVFAFALLVLGSFMTSRLQINLPADLRHPLFLTGCFLTAYAGLAPLAISGGCVFFAIVVANVMGQKRAFPTTNRRSADAGLHLSLNDPRALAPGPRNWR